MLGELCVDAVEKDSKWPVWLGCGELQLDNFIAGTGIVIGDVRGAAS